MIRLYFAALQFLFISCNSSASFSSDSKEKVFADSSITIILQNIEKDVIKLSYRNKFNDEENLYSDSSIVIVDGQQFVPLRIKYKDKNIMFPLLINDTLLIKKGGNGEYELTRSVREKRKYDTLFLKFCNQRLSVEYDKFSALRQSLLPDNFNSSKPFVIRVDPKKNKNIYSQLYLQSQDLNIKEWQILDSLFNRGQILEKYKFVYGALINARYINTLIECYNGGMAIEVLRSLRDERDRLFKKEYLLYDAGLYKETINGYIFSIIGKNRFYKYGKNSITIDYTKAFDSASSYFNKSVLAYVKFICLKNIKEQYPDSIFSKYYAEYKESLEDSNEYIAYFSNYSLPQSGSVDSIMTIAKSVYTLNDVIYRQYKGSYIYIDFWASWCIPCRNEMPSSLELRKEYSKANIKFIYLSIDDNYLNWISASKNEIINEYKDSYLLKSPRTSIFLKQLKMNSIPRYILIDPKGDVLHFDAPSPGSKEIRNILDKCVGTQ